MTRHRGAPRAAGRVYVKLKNNINNVSRKSMSLRDKGLMIKTIIVNEMSYAKRSFERSEIRIIVNFFETKIRHL
jgi:ribosomal protein L22